MRKQWFIVALVVGVLTAGAWLGLRLAPDIFPVEVGSQAPDFQAVDLATGDTVEMESLRGQVVLLNIWATWCAPCREEMPSMQRLHEQYRERGLRVVAVSVDVGGPDVVRDFQRQMGLTFEIWQDQTQQIQRIYQTTAVPESFVINRRGEIVKKLIGPHDWTSGVNSRLIERLLRQ